MAHQIRRRVSLPFPLQEVWQAVTDPEAISEWFGARVRFELRVGGRASFEGDDGERLEGRVEVVDAPRRLAFLWWPADAAERAANFVEFVLEEVDGGTDVTVVETSQAGAGPTLPAASVVPSGERRIGFLARVPAGTRA